MMFRDMLNGLAMRKLNCWEFKKCGRERNGHAGNKGLCPTMAMTALNGIHGGNHGGRCCWVVKGTLCGGPKSGAYPEKFGMCCSCNFYRLVMQEEGIGFILSTALFRRMEKGGNRKCGGNGRGMNIAV